MRDPPSRSANRESGEDGFALEKSEAHPGGWSWKVQRLKVPSSTRPWTRAGQAPKFCGGEFSCDRVLGVPVPGDGLSDSIPHPRVPGLLGGPGVTTPHLGRPRLHLPHFLVLSHPFLRTLNFRTSCPQHRDCGLGMSERVRVNPSQTGGKTRGCGDPKKENLRKHRYLQKCSPRTKKKKNLVISYTNVFSAKIRAKKKRF